ncbi:Multifunctional conjugation protein TraI (plasmid) [Rickettsiales bacterium Ac37b]|nr:Multifunctional conjugation protein TraI [Rickettsiales bacterium Ac37b]
MLSVKAFSSAGAASKYYSQGDYYGSEGEGIWLGSGAKDFGLNGNFTAKIDKSFNNLLKGILPGGQVLGRKTKEGIEHRPGVDLTFSAPKSFSIEMLVFASPEKRKSLEHALLNSVDKTLSYIEKQGYVIVRRGQGGKEREKINKLTFAGFLHTTNRNLEPQAHIHTFLANVAKCSDDKYRSINTDILFKKVKLLGQVFRNELAIETKKLGYQINTNMLSDGSSSFELSHVDPKLIEAFSTRRKDIDEICKLRDIKTKEGRDKVVIHSRKAKEQIDESSLKSLWNETAQKVQNDINQTKVNNHNKEYSKNVNNLSKLKEGISNVIQKLSNRYSLPLDTADQKTAAIDIRDLALLCIKDVSYYKSVFTRNELEEKCLKYSIGSFRVQDIVYEIDEFTKSGFLIAKDNMLTTRELFDKENIILKCAENAICSSKSIVKDKCFNKHLDKFTKRELAKNQTFKVNDQQKTAIKHIMTSSDKIVTMEGLPGVGKSTVLNAIRDISGRKVISLIGLGEKFKGSAPTASAAKTLSESAKVEAKTLHSFLAKYQGFIEGRGKESLPAMKREYKKTIIFIDEASLISTNTMFRLLKLQEMFGFRLVMTGDTKQLGSVEAGKPFEQMLNILKPVKLDQIVRQKDNSHKEAVLATSKGDIVKSLDIHKDNIKQVSKKLNKMVESSTALYLSYSKLKRDKTLIISPTRILRDKINENIVNNLKQLNELSKIDNKDYIFTTYRNQDMTTADYSFAPAFKKGEVIKFNARYSNGIAKGDYLKIKDINEISNSLILEKEGKSIVFNLKKNVDYSNKMEVFYERDIKLYKGLKIVFTKNNKIHGLINSETGIIQNLDSKKATLRLEDGTTKTIQLEHLKHIDYGYAVTVHCSQGKTVQNTIAAINNNKLLSNQKMWLVATSRHQSKFTAIVEDKNKLQQYLVSNNGKETSAIEFSAGIKTDKTLDRANNLQETPNNNKINQVKELQSV